MNKIRPDLDDFEREVNAQCSKPVSRTLIAAARDADTLPGHNEAALQRGDTIRLMKWGLGKSNSDTSCSIILMAALFGGCIGRPQTEIAAQKMLRERHDPRAHDLFLAFRVAPDSNPHEYLQRLIKARSWEPMIVVASQLVSQSIQLEAERTDPLSNARSVINSHLDLVEAYRLALHITPAPTAMPPGITRAAQKELLETRPERV